MKHTLALIVALFTTLSAPAQQLDFGDRTSATITSKAWGAMNAKNYSDAAAYAQECVRMYEKQAVEMQKQLKEPVPNTDKEAVSKLWALNDVGTCLFITGQALEKLEKKPEALAAYKKLVDTLPFAQCWDPQGWFWKPADGAKGRVKALEFDSLK